MSWGDLYLKISEQNLDNLNKHEKQLLEVYLHIVIDVCMF